MSSSKNNSRLIMILFSFYTIWFQSNGPDALIRFWLADCWWASRAIGSKSTILLRFASNPIRKPDCTRHPVRRGHSASTGAVLHRVRFSEPANRVESNPKRFHSSRYPHRGFRLSQLQLQPYTWHPSSCLAAIR